MHHRNAAIVFTLVLFSALGAVLEEQAHSRWNEASISIHELYVRDGSLIRVQAQEEIAHVLIVAV